MDFRSFARRNLPHLVAVYRLFKRHFEGRTLRRMSNEAIFSDIFRNNKWEGQTSVSGPGSDPDQTVIVRRELPPLLDRLGILTLLDIPCGDFNWMSRIQLDGIDYTGADIVPEIIEANRTRYQRRNVRFVKLDLIADPIPRVDLILCRDCLVHFSFEDMFRALMNICASGSEYLLTTTFPALTRNQRIATGQGRPINLEVKPFHLPRPLHLINEEYTKEGGAYADKSLGLWEVDQVRRALTSHANQE